MSEPETNRVYPGKKQTYHRFYAMPDHSQQQFNKDLLAFLAASPTAFHAVNYLGRMLEAGGFRQLDDQQQWRHLSAGRYFLVRNGSSLIAFCHDGHPAESGLRMAGAHTDSPGFKIKPRPLLVKHGLVQLGVETYGGALLSPWFDRDLSIAGRVTWKDRQGEPHISLIDFSRPVAYIPSLAIHLNKEANEGRPINRQTDLVPLIMQESEKDGIDFHAILKNQLMQEHGADAELEILGHELFLYDCQPPARIGIQGEFIAGARLDNLLSCFILIRALIGEDSRNGLVMLNDHEEVGSLSTSGAQGTFLKSVMERLLPEHGDRYRCLGRSLFVSADNAHAVHPNFADRHEQGHLPQMNRGPVIKYNANQRYATTSCTAAFYRMLADRLEVPVQEFVMRSDLNCGSTLGPIVAGGMGVQTIDIGVPTLGMHSVRELAGSLDAWSMSRVMESFFSLPAEDPVWRCLA